MSCHFIIGANPMNNEEKEAIIKWMSESYAWWNWIDGFWLVKDDTNFLTTDKLRDKFQKLAPSANIIIFLVNPEDSAWSGYGPSGDNEDMFEWIDEIWDES